MAKKLVAESNMIKNDVPYKAWRSKNSFLESQAMEVTCL